MSEKPYGVNFVAGDLTDLLSSSSHSPFHSRQKVHSSGLRPKPLRAVYSSYATTTVGAPSVRTSVELPLDFMFSSTHLEPAAESVRVHQI